MHLDQAETIHHWAGISDGRYSYKHLSSNYLHDDMFQSAKERIMNSSALVIGEIGMASKRVFDMVELVCRLSRQSSRLFGGLQVIAAGDFKQLPPVPNYRYDDDGSFCFESKQFCDLFPHHVKLKDAARQTEQALINAFHELCDGEPCKETETLLRSLDRDLNPLLITCARLFGTNFEVDYVNSLLLDDQPEDVAYTAVDTGEKHHLAKFGTPRNLVLKVGATVIATRNLLIVLLMACRE